MPIPMELVELTIILPPTNILPPIPTPPVTVNAPVLVDVELEVLVIDMI